MQYCIAVVHQMQDSVAVRSYTCVGQARASCLWLVETTQCKSGFRGARRNETPRPEPSRLPAVCAISHSFYAIPDRR